MSDPVLTQPNTETSKGKETAEQRPTLRPAVTIIETDKGFTLTAELPGVPKEQVSVQVENGTLTIQGDIQLPLPTRMDATYAEVQAASYKRAFTLSRELDTTKIEASQKDGVLTLHIPKAEHAQPRKIAVQIA